MEKLLLVILILNLAACATHYQKNGAFGGYEEKLVGTKQDILQVQFEGNLYTSDEKIYEFAMLRTAEIMRACGHQQFQLIHQQRTPRKGGIVEVPVSAKAMLQARPAKEGLYAETVIQTLRTKHSVASNRPVAKSNCVRVASTANSPRAIPSRITRTPNQPSFASNQRKNSRLANSQIQQTVASLSAKIAALEASIAEDHRENIRAKERAKWLRIGQALGSPTSTGALSESISNAAEAANDPSALARQRRLRVNRSLLHQTIQERNRASRALDEIIDELESSNRNIEYQNSVLHR